MCQFEYLIELLDHQWADGMYYISSEYSKQAFMFSPFFNSNFLHQVNFFDLEFF